jgi:hypothetical protein
MTISGDEKQRVRGLSEGINWDDSRKRWVAYLDILGFASLVMNRRSDAAMHVYQDCLDQVERHAKQYPKLGFAYFSDTFLIYANDDTHGSLGFFEQSVRWFYNVALQKGIPFRGAMACGEFLADKPNNVFIGEALIEASRVGEKYNWIGLVMAPSATARLEKLNLPMNERLNYRQWDIPLKDNADEHLRTEKAYAYLIGASTPVNGQNEYIQKLQNMASSVKCPKVLAKYENTIQFLKKGGILKVIPNSQERGRMWGGPS